MLSAVPETPPKSQHQIVWIVKVVQFVAYVDEKVFVYVGFQRQSLIESFQLFAFIDDVASKAYADGENRHDKFGSKGNSGSQLLRKRWTIEFYVAIVSYTGYMLTDISAFIVLDVDGQACPENLFTLYKGFMFKPMIPNLPSEMCGTSFQMSPLALPAP